MINGQDWQRGARCQSCDAIVRALKLDLQDDVVVQERMKNGFIQPDVCRGRVLSCRATASRSARFGKYCRSEPCRARPEKEVPTPGSNAPGWH